MNHYNNSNNSAAKEINRRATVGLIERRDLNLVTFDRPIEVELEIPEPGSPEYLALRVDDSAPGSAIIPESSSKTVTRNINDYSEIQS